MEPVYVYGLLWSTYTPLGSVNFLGGNLGNLGIPYQCKLKEDTPILVVKKIKSLPPFLVISPHWFIYNDFV